MKNWIKQGDAYDLEIDLTLEGTPVTDSNLPLIQTAEFCLGDLRQICGDHRGDFGIAAGGLAVGHHDDRCAGSGNLYRSRDDAVGNDIHAVFAFDFLTGEPNAHPVGFVRNSILVSQECSDPHLRKGILLRPQQNPKRDRLRILLGDGYLPRSEQVGRYAVVQWQFIAFLKLSALESPQGTF